MSEHIWPRLNTCLNLSRTVNISYSVCVSVCVCVCVCICVCGCVWVYVRHNHNDSHTHTPIHILSQAITHKHTHTHTHMHTHKHTHTHTRTRTQHRGPYQEQQTAAQILFINIKLINYQSCLSISVISMRGCGVCFACVCVCVCVCVWVCVCVCVCVCICVCVCQCVSVAIHVSLSKFHNSVIFSENLYVSFCVSVWLIDYHFTDFDFFDFEIEPCSLTMFKIGKSRHFFCIETLLCVMKRIIIIISAFIVWIIA